MSQIITIAKAVYRYFFPVLHSYRATITLAGQRLTLDITETDITHAQREAERIIDDCGFLINLVQLDAPETV